MIGDAAVAAKPAAASGFTPITDSFNRADNASSVGTTDTGQAWTTNNGTMGINSNELYCTALSSDAVCTVDSTITDVRVKGVPTTTLVGRYFGVVGRCVDNNNYYLAQSDSAASSIYKKVAGSFTQLANFGTAMATNDQLQLRCNGTTIELLVNGTTVLSTTDSSLTTGTRCGIRFSITSLRADSFAVDAA